jgi:hypothetical protein
MATKSQFPEQYPVSKEQALDHARLTIRRAWIGGMPDFQRWAGLELDPDPLVINDLNGVPLLYEFSVMDGKNAVGTVKAGASKLTAAPVLAIEMRPRTWDPQLALREARTRAKKDFPRADKVETELVCYSYPKICVRVRGERSQDATIYDAASFEPVVRFGSDELEGFTAWSYLDEIGGRDPDKRVRRWDLANQELEATREKVPQIFARGLKDSDIARIQTRLTADFFKHFSLLSWRVLNYAPRCSPHDCFELYAQQTDVYCAVATGQMILDFYRYYFTQDQIAAAMNTGSGGTTNPDQVAGYESLSNNCLDATFDSSANWAEAKAEIDANRPVKSGIPNHARACAGWMRQNLTLLSQPARRWLRIYDPWPWNADICAGGQVVWEDWDAVTHTNFIYVRHI